MSKQTAPACGVVGCAREGRSQVCPYDQRRHGHGRIHYTQGDAGLTFYDGDWFKICDAHYVQIVNWLKQLQRKPSDAS